MIYLRKLREDPFIRYLAFALVSYFAWLVFFTIFSKQESEKK